MIQANELSSSGRELGKMFVFLVLLIFGYLAARGDVSAKPVRLTIDCGSEDRKQTDITKLSNIFKTSDELDVDSFCDLIQKVIPKAVKNGQFVPTIDDYDMAQEGDTFNPIFQTAPRNLGLDDLKLPPVKIPPLKIRKLKVPPLKPTHIGKIRTPKVGDSMLFSNLRSALSEDSSAEKMERFKKGIQKMLHVVKVLGQVDNYLSERIKIVIDKLSKTFSD